MKTMNLKLLFLTIFFTFFLCHCRGRKKFRGTNVYGEQEFIRLSTPYPFTDDPNEIFRTKSNTKKFLQEIPLDLHEMDDYVTIGRENAEKWPNDTVRYTLDIGLSQSFKERFRRITKKLEDVSCVRFKATTAQSNSQEPDPQHYPLRVYPTDQDRCYAIIGFQYENSELAINESICNDDIFVTHLLMHVLGFDHEHVRRDRDTYVSILSSAYAASASALMDIRKHCNAYTKYMPYNPYSIMHPYPRHQFIRPRNFTLGPKIRIPLQVSKSWWKYPLHQLDINNINLHYKCGEKLSICRDMWSEEFCERKGRGKMFYGTEVVELSKNASCVDPDFSFLFCAKTCGYCYKLL